MIIKKPARIKNDDSVVFINDHLVARTNSRERCKTASIRSSRIMDLIVSYVHRRAKGACAFTLCTML